MQATLLEALLTSMAMAERRSKVAARLRLAIAMQADGAVLMRENLRRRHPEASEAELDRLFERWLLDRPPDAPGRPVPWPRRRSRQQA
jgi:hypothetical protein